MKKRDHWKGIDVDGEIILKRILKKRFGEVALNSFSSRLGGVAGSYEHGSEPPGSVRCWKCLSA
jgi:hypothetical protein